MATRNFSSRRGGRPRRKTPEPPLRTAEFVIGHIGRKGDGVAETAEGPAYVPLTVPGDRVRAHLRDSRAESFDLLEPGPARQRPPCPHFGTCGGCVLQHVEHEFYLAWKREQVVSALAARGLGGVPVRACIAVPPATRRRATFRAAAGKGGMKIGFSERRGRRVCAVDSCEVVVPALEAALPALRELAETAGPGGIYVLASDTGLDVNLLFEPDAGLNPLAVPQWARTHDAARVSALGEVLIQRHAPRIQIDGLAVHPHPGAFLQPSEAGEAVLTRLVLEGAGDATAVADLFAGVGTFCFALGRGARVHAVEGESAALETLERTVRHAPPGRLKPVTTERRDLERAPLTAKELNRFEAAVFDPPRAGAAAQAAVIAASKVPRVVAVSCNPATFARDARTLVDGGYRLHHVTPVDQFVWSAHIELVAVFGRD